MARHIAVAVLPALLLGGCVTTAYRTQTWGPEPYGPPAYDAQWARYGHVESIRENVRSQQGNPAAGAVAGAIIGGLLFGGYSPAQTAVGLAGGAMVGAAASQGTAGEDRMYEVFVRFDDGALERYVYQNVLPFRVNDPVVLTAQGLYHR